MLACLGLALLGLAGGLARMHSPPGPLGREATYLGMAASLWEERDLAFDARDEARLFAAWGGEPTGLTLVDDGGTRRYSGPLVYPLVAAPAYGLFGPRGPLLLNAALYLLMLGVAWRMVDSGEGWGGLFAGGFFFASAAFSTVFRVEPPVLVATCLFLALALWHSGRAAAEGGFKSTVRWLAAGALGALAWMSQPLLAVVAAVVAADLLLGRRWRHLTIFLVGSLAVAAALAGLTWRATGHWQPGPAVVPLAAGAAEAAAPEAAAPEAGAPEIAAPSRVGSGTTAPSGSVPAATPGAVSTAGAGAVEPGLMELRDFFLGRYTGLLPYFPFAVFAVAVGLLGPREQPQRLLLGALGVYAAVLLISAAPTSPDSVGNPHLALVYPAFFFLVGQRPGRWSLLLPFAAAGLWTLPAVALLTVPHAREPHAQLHVRSPAFRLLPVELQRLARGELPGYVAASWGEALWLVPRESFFTEDRHPNGVWVKGSSSSEVVVVTEEPEERIWVCFHALAAGTLLTVESDEETVTVLFDTLAKRQGSIVELAPSPSARGRRGRGGGAPLYYHRLRLTIRGGVQASRHFPGSEDHRYLGVFLDFTGDGL